MEETAPKPFVFVLMPFSAGLDDTYQLGIKSACMEAGAFCERVDEQIYDESVLERIHSQIAKADIVVAELTGLNPNVFYEIGYARALNKRMVLLAKDARTIPFDLQNNPHIIYEGKIALLKVELEKRVRWCIENPKTSLYGIDLNLQVLVNGKLIEDNPEIQVELKEHLDQNDNYSGIMYVTIAIHNPTNKILNPDSFNLALILPDTIYTRFGDYEYTWFRSVTLLPDGRQIYNMKQLDVLFPKAWDTFEMRLSTKDRHLLDRTTEIILRLFTEIGPKDYPFTLKLHSQGVN